MKNILLGFLILLVGCKAGNEADLRNETALEELQRELDELFDGQIKENEPGVALLVSYDSQFLVGKGYGLRDVENKAPMTASTIMEMASVSKQFTALAVLSLVDKGLLSLDDYVYNYFPYKSFNKVTVGQLLNHTSGLADAEDAFYSEWDDSKMAKNKDIMAWYAKKDRTIAPPGEEFVYNNGTYDLLPLLVEKVSGQPFSTFVKENIFEKAGMKNTFYYDPVKLEALEDKAYNYEKKIIGRWKKLDDHFLGRILGAGGVRTSVQDYFEYDKALRSKTILSVGTHNLIFKPTTKTLPEEDDEFEFLQASPFRYAMGWMVSDDFEQHSGSWFGTSTFVLREKKRPLTIALFANSEELWKGDKVEKTYRLVDDYLKKRAERETK